MTHRLGTCGLGTRRSESQEAAFTEERGSCRPRAFRRGDGAPGGEPPPAGQHLPSQPWPRSMALHGLGCLTKGPPEMTFLCPDAREVGRTAFRKGFREERGATSPPAPAGSLRAEELKIPSPRAERGPSPGPKKELCTPHPRCKCKPLSPVCFSAPQQWPLVTAPMPVGGRVVIHEPCSVLALRGERDCGADARYNTGAPRKRGGQGEKPVTGDPTQAGEGRRRGAGFPLGGGGMFGN